MVHAEEATMTSRADRKPCSAMTSLVRKRCVKVTMMTSRGAGRISPPNALSRAMSESCCFDRSASDDDLDLDDPEVKATWSTESTSGKVSFIIITVVIKFATAGTINNTYMKPKYRNNERKNTGEFFCEILTTIITKCTERDFFQVSATSDDNLLICLLTKLLCDAEGGDASCSRQNY